MLKSILSLAVLHFAGLARAQSALNISAALPTVQIGYLDVPGASLYYEAMGSGPMLLCIPGGNGNLEPWRNAAMLLQTNFTVVLYDRRGFSRSYLSSTQPQDYSRRLQTDVDDASRLIQHLSNNQTVNVVGTSSGAIVALELLQTHPELLKTLVSHEVPAIKMLPDNATLTIQQNHIYETYRKYGVPPAMIEFGTLYKAGSLNTYALLASMDGRNNVFTWGNDQYWLEREMPVYPLQDFDLDVLGKYKSLLMVANGVQTDPTAMQYRANVVMAQKFGLNVTMLPGSHVGYQTDPAAWSAALSVAIKSRG